MRIHCSMHHYLLYEFILLLHKWFQSFSHFSFKPAQKWNDINSLQIFSLKNFLTVNLFGSSVLPFTFFLCEDEFVSKFGVSLILPPEFVSILPVFSTETKHGFKVKLKVFFHVMKPIYRHATDLNLLVEATYHQTGKHSQKTVYSIYFIF